MKVPLIKEVKPILEEEKPKPIKQEDKPPVINEVSSKRSLYSKSMSFPLQLQMSLPKTLDLQSVERT